MLWFMGLQRVSHNWVTELNWTDELEGVGVEKRGGKENQPAFLPSSGTEHFQEKAELEAIYANGTPLQYSCLENPMDGGAW